MSYDQFTNLMAASVLTATPLLLAALGGLIGERAGVASIGLEGYMLGGAFTAVVVSFYAGPWAGLAGGAAGGLAMGALHAYVSITLRADQIVSGIAINILALGLTGFLLGIVFPSTSSPEEIPGFGSWSIPGLSRVPFLGEVLFDQGIFVYIAIALLAATVVFLRNTTAGLILRAVGEAPVVCLTRGVHVAQVRYLAVLYSGAVAGLGGAMLAIAVVRGFTEGMTAGRGFIALAAIIFAGWRPMGIAVACLLFGVADSGQQWANALGVDVPFQILALAPYVLTLLALTIYRRSNAPAALGQPLEARAP
ncbi:MAG: ABC transporter permease [Actinomycetota bacterium]